MDVGQELLRTNGFTGAQQKVRCTMPRKISAAIASAKTQKVAAEPEASTVAKPSVAMKRPVKVAPKPAAKVDTAKDTAKRPVVKRPASKPAATTSAPKVGTTKVAVAKGTSTPRKVVVAKPKPAKAEDRKPLVRINTADMVETPKNLLTLLRNGKVDWTGDIVVQFVHGGLTRIGRVYDNDGDQYEPASTVGVRDHSGKKFDVYPNYKGSTDTDGSILAVWYVDDLAKVADSAPWKVGELATGAHLGKPFTGKKIVAIDYYAADDESVDAQYRDRFVATIQNGRGKIRVLSGSKDKDNRITGIEG